MNKAEIFLQEKGIKNKPIDSGIGAPENHSRYRVSNAIIDFHRQELEDLKKFVHSKYELAEKAYFNSNKEPDKFGFSSQQFAHREILLEIHKRLTNL